MKLLSELSLYPEIVKATRIALAFRPNDIELLNHHSQALIATGDPSSAVESAYVASSLSPENGNLRRQLITCLEGAGDWKAVVSERVALLDTRFSPSQDISWPDKKDQIALANAYLFAEQPDKTVEICKTLLNEDEQDGISHAMLGEAYMALGNTEEALEHLDRANSILTSRSCPLVGFSAYSRKNQ